MHHQTLWFANNSAELDQIQKLQLDDIGKKCLLGDFSFLKIYAYADTIGSKEDNMSLSKNRAMEVKHYLLDQNPIDSTKMLVQWFGEEIDGTYELHSTDAKPQRRCVDLFLYMTEQDR